MSDNKYWTDLADLHQTPEFVEKAGKEISSEVPLGDVLGDEQSHGGRRDFLKMMGFSITAAAIASSCKIPVKNPFLTYSIPMRQYPILFRALPSITLLPTQMVPE